MSSLRRKFRICRMLAVFFLSSLTFCLWVGDLSLTWQAGFGQVAIAQSPDPSQLVQQGIELYQVGDFKGAISHWQTALTFYQKTKNRANEAIVRENLARTYEQIGQSAEAINYWEKAIAYYRQIGNFQQLGKMLTELAQSYISLGQPRRAIALLCGADIEQSACVSDSALQIALTYKDRLIEAAALGILGDAYRLNNNYPQAIAVLQASLKIATEINNPVYQSSVLNSLANAYISLAKVNYRRANSAQQRDDLREFKKFKEQALNHDLQAIKFLQNSLKLTRKINNKSTELRVLLNSIEPYYRTQAPTSAKVAVTETIALLDKLPDSRTKVFAAIDLANFIQPISALDPTGLYAECPKGEVGLKEELLKKAILTARRISDSRSESFALGRLGHVYECVQDYKQALDLTRQAELSADQDLNSKDSLYLWEWQAGRIFKAQNQMLDAINAYERAVTTVEDIRSKILIANRDLQLDFRYNVEPIYRELAALKLDSVSRFSVESVERQKNLSKVIQTIDSLKLAELQNYLGDDCVLTAIQEKSVDSVGVDPATAVFNSIVFKDRTAIVISLPSGEKRYTWIDVNNNTLRQEINEFRRGLERYRDLTYDSQQAQKLYNWIINPFAKELEQAQVKTLVFIQDGILRSVPMAALYDGKKFLVQKYAIANTPSLTLTDPDTSRQELSALALGVTKSVTVDGQKFPALTNVDSEINQIQKEIPRSKQLLNEKFTRFSLQQELSKTNYPIIHMATHAQFRSDPEDTFLVTGNNDKLTITNLETALRSVPHGSQRVELLALTACQTAAGDDDAALGLAGVAVQSGVKSALASLWFIQDAPTVTLINKFYDSWLNSKVSKAEALRVAQTALIESGGQSAHPAYWAGFILVGNWL